MAMQKAHNEGFKEGQIDCIKIQIRNVNNLTAEIEQLLPESAVIHAFRQLIKQWKKDLEKIKSAGKGRGLARGKNITSDGSGKPAPRHNFCKDGCGVCFVHQSHECWRKEAQNNAKN